MTRTRKGSASSLTPKGYCVKPLRCLSMVPTATCSVLGAAAWCWCSVLVLSARCCVRRGSTFIPADIRVTISCLPRGAVPLHTDAAGTAPPDAFGPFRVLHQIGAGTLGPVFRAYDAQQDRLVTVKQFKLDLLPERLHQLVAEFEGLIAAELTHPFIAAPISTGPDGSTVYLARDFVAADSLDVAVRDRVARP